MLDTVHTTYRVSVLYHIWFVWNLIISRCCYLYKKWNCIPPMGQTIYTTHGLYVTQTYRLPDLTNIINLVYYLKRIYQTCYREYMSNTSTTVQNNAMSKCKWKCSLQVCTKPNLFTDLSYQYQQPYWIKVSINTVEEILFIAFLQQLLLPKEMC